MFIGIDLGTSSIKVILIDEKQNTLASHSENIDLLNPDIGFYEQDPKSWFRATLKCFSKIKLQKSKEFAAVKALGISGQMHGATLINKNNEILHPCILWNDTRSISQCLKMEESYPSLRKESGNIAMPGFTSPKILWLKENKNEVFKHIHKVLLPKDYLRFRLSGAFFTDMSDASGTLWLNVKERNWSDGLLNLTELSKDHMPELVEGSDVTSCIEKNLANEIGFENTVIIAGGAGDQAAGAVGSGVIHPNQSVISLGTSGVYFSPTENFVSNTNQAVHSFCHCIPDTWHHMSVMLSATNCLDWANKMFGLDIKESLKRIENYSNENFELHSTPFFLPYLTGERTPYNNPYLRGSFHMLSTSTSIDAILYSVIEGITFGIKDGFEAVHAVSPRSNETYLVGGGSKSIFWTDLVTSILNQPIIIGEDSSLGPALGVARLAMLATKDFKKKDVIKSMKILRESNISEKLSDRLLYRYNKWKEIGKSNEQIAKKMMER